MRIGLNIVSLTAEGLREVGPIAERAGYSSVWLGEHLFFPAKLGSTYPGGPGTQPFDSKTEQMDPLLVLSHVAATTTNLRLGVGVYLLPLRHPILAAKAFTTVDHLSRGRLDFAFGVGWMREEFDALGVDFDDRGALTDESLAVIRALLDEEVPKGMGPAYPFEPLSFEPKPYQGTARSRIIAGGYSAPAYRRAVQSDGWYGRIDRLHPETNKHGGWDLPSVAAFVEDLRARVARAGRDADAFEVIGALSRMPEPHELPELAATGLDEIIVNPWRIGEGQHMGISADATVAQDAAARLNLTA